MKKFTLLVAFLAMISLTSCNVSYGLGNYSFKKVHIVTPDYNKCVNITKWHNNEIGIEVKTEDYGSLYLSEGTYILVEDKCPICGK